MRTWVVGDIHGGYRALMHVLERSQFDREHDRLIALGDLVDGWLQAREVVDELLTLKHLVLILGNHDEWLLQWAEQGGRREWAHEAWVTQGGEATLASYGYQQIPEAHVRFFRSAKLLHHERETGRVFVHGGIDPARPLENQPRELCLWDRELLQQAWERHQVDPAARLTPYHEIYVGHTTTSFYNSVTPVHFCEVWGMDTGGGWEGKLSMMEIDTKQTVQSDHVYLLYPDAKHGRQRRAS